MNPPPPAVPTPDRRMVSLRLSAEARNLLQRLSAARGLSQAALLEVLLRDEEARVRRRA